VSAGARTRVVLLDALGTLLALVPPTAALVGGLRRDHGLEVSESVAAQALGREMAYYRAHNHEASDALGLAQLRSRCARVLRWHLGAQAIGIDERDLLRTLLGALRFVAYPDAAPALRALGDLGVKRLVVSNWDVSLHDVLAHTGLDRDLDGALTSAEIGVAKPDRAIFDAALEWAGAEPDGALHVGDSLDHDIAGARAAGVPAVLVVRGDQALLAAQRARGVRAIASLSELPGLAAQGFPTQ